MDRDPSDRFIDPFGKWRGFIRRCTSTAAIVVLVMSSACATAPEDLDTPPTSPTSEGPVPSKYDSADLLTSAGDLATPPSSLNPNTFTRASQEDTRAWLDLDSALGDLIERDQALSQDPLPELGAVATDLAADPIDAPADANSSERDPSTIKDYAAARLAYLDGDIRTARQLLGDVLRLDPQAAPAWQLLAEIARLQKNRLEQLAACERVLQNEPGSVYAMTHLGRYAADVGRSESAARLLALAWRAHSSDHSSPPAPLLLDSLAVVLADLGYLNAAIEASGLGLERLPLAIGEAPLYREELGRLYQGRSDLLRRIGDLNMRLGRAQAAGSAYDAAASIPQLPASGLLSRRVWAQLCAGKPASATNILVHQLATEPEQPHRELVILSGYLRQHAKLHAQLVRSMDLLQEKRPDSITFILVKAAALPQRQGRSYLLKELSSQPQETALLRLALQLCENRKQMLALTLDGLDDHLGLLRAYADALLQVDRDSEALLQTLERDGDSDRESWRLLRARLNLAAGNPQLARDQLEESLLAGQVESDDSLHAVCELLNDLDDEQHVLELLAQSDWKQRLPLLYHRLRIESFHRLQLQHDALAECEALEAAVEPEAIDLLIHARVLGSLRRSAETEPLLLEAIELQPQLEQAHSDLLETHIFGGALPDPRKLSLGARRLHQSLPNSRTLRRLRAEEEIRSQNMVTALDLLLDLAREDPSDQASLELLVTLWVAMNRPVQGEAWLLAAMEQHPFESALAQALGQLLLLSGQPERAVTFLERYLVEHRGNASIQTQHERALHQSDQTDLALAIARQRLNDSDMRPETVSTSLTRAMVQLADGDQQGAVHTLASLAEGVVLTQEQCDDASHLLTSFVRLQQRRAQTLGLMQVSQLEMDVAYNIDVAGLWRRTEIHQAALALAWLRLVTVLERDDVQTAIALLHRFDGEGRLTEIFAGVDEQLATVDLIQGLYIASTWASLSDKGQETLLREVLRLDPDHAMANNNLGYLLVNRDENLEQATALIERAYNLQPESQDIIDSLGWARYKTGQFDDVVDGDGRVVTRGAISLLREAREVATPVAFPVVADHLGDSLWRVRRYDEAKQQWQEAREALPEEGQPWQRELRQQLERKLDAMQGSEPPPVAGSPIADAVSDPPPS